MRRVRLVLALVVLGLFLCGFDYVDARVYDKGELFTESQEQILQKMILRIRDEEEMDLVVVTTTDAEGKDAYQYAEWFYYDAGYGFGYGDSDKGTLYLIDLDNREIYVYCSEDAEDYISDGDIETLLDVTYEYASQGLYYESAVAFLEKMPDCAGKSVVPLVVGVIISFIISGVVTFILVRKQRTYEKVPYNAYMDEGATLMYRKEDRFINTTVVVREIDTDSSGSRSGGGGHSRGSGGGRSL